MADSDRRCPIAKVNYDYFTRPIQPDGTDGHWAVGNPVDATTGLLYEPTSYNDATAGGGSSVAAHDSTDWYDLLQTFVRHGYKSALQASPADHPLLLVERSYNPPPIRQQMLECIFEELQAPATFLAKDAVLSCYACGRVTATVVDVGHSGTTVTPVHEGYVEQKGIRANPTGVAAMDALLLEHLDALNQRIPIMPLYQVRRLPPHEPRRSDIHLAARLYLAQQCRQAGIGAAINTTSTSSGNFQAPHKPFELPDGTKLDVPSSTRFAVADLVLGSDAESVKRRDELLLGTKQKLSSYIMSIPAAAVAEGEDADKQDEDEFTEAAAVGISKRKTKRTTVTTATATTTEPAKQRTGFSNQVLQRACVPYLQTHLEQHLTSSPIASMICDAAYRCDRDQQVALLGTVIVGGGGSCLGPTEQAVPDLIREQVEGIIHQHTPGWRVKVLTPGFAERSVLSWLGGSILASLGTFHEMWITKAEYEEWGTAIVNRKCP